MQKMVFSQSNTLKLYLFLNDVIFNIISQFHIFLKFYLNFCFLFHVHINVELFTHAFMHLFKRADCFYVIVYLLCETLVEHPTSFVEASQKKRSSKSERLTGRKPVREQSERASRYFVGFATGLSASES